MSNISKLMDDLEGAINDLQGTIADLQAEKAETEDKISELENQLECERQKTSDETLEDISEDIVSKSIVDFIRNLMRYPELLYSNKPMFQIVKSVLYRLINDYRSAPERFFIELEQEFPGI